MKRALAMALGAVMVAGSAAPASAAAQIDFSGYYRVYNMNDVNLGKRNDNYPGDQGDRNSTMTDSYWAHRLNIDLVFRATDEISVHWRLRAPSFKRFGSSGAFANDNQDRTAMVTHHIYGQIDQDWGTVRVGQIDDGFDSYGLGSLGYVPSTDPMWTNVSPFDAGGRIDGVRYNNKWDNGFGLMAQYQIVDNNHGENNTQPSLRDAAGDRTDETNRWADQDYSRYRAEGTYEWDGGAAAFGVIYDRNATEFNTDLWEPTLLGTDGQFDKTNAWYINPAVMQSWGNFSVHFEGEMGWGTTDVTNAARRQDWRSVYTNQDVSLAGQRNLKSEGYAFFLDGDYNYGPGNVTLSGWWVSGTSLGEGYGSFNSGDLSWDPTRYGKSKSLVSIDQGNFYPLIVAYNGTASNWGRESENAVSMANDGIRFIDRGVLTGVGSNDTEALAARNALLSRFTNVTYIDGVGANNNQRNMFNSLNNDSSNHWAITLGGNHAFTDDISLHYALGYLALNKPNYKVVDRAVREGNVISAGYVEQDKDLGWEADLGMSFQLLDNLQFVSSFGYMFNGDAYKTLRGYRYTDNTATGGNETIKAVWDDADDSYVWYNTLTFSF